LEKAKKKILNNNSNRVIKENINQEKFKDGNPNDEDKNTSKMNKSMEKY
jgi:hypothetical protein